MVAQLGNGEGLNAALGALANQLASGQIREFAEGLAGQLSDNPELQQLLANLIGNAVSSGVGYAAGGESGANAASNMDRNNRMLHPDERKWILDTAAKEFAERMGIDEEEARRILGQQALSMVDEWWAWALAPTAEQLADPAYMAMRDAARDFLWAAHDKEFFANPYTNDYQGFFTVRGDQFMDPTSMEGFYKQSGGSDFSDFYKNYIKPGITNPNVTYSEYQKQKILELYRVVTAGDGSVAPPRPDYDSSNPFLNPGYEKARLEAIAFLESNGYTVADYDAIGQKNNREVFTRAVGALEVVGGVSGVAVAIALAPEAGGAALVVVIGYGIYNADHVIAGTVTMVTGQHTDTFGKQGAMWLGVPAEYYDIFDMGLGTIGGVAVSKIAKNAQQVKAIAQAVAEKTRIPKTLDDVADAIINETPQYKAAVKGTGVDSGNLSGPMTNIKKNADAAEVLALTREAQTAEIMANKGFIVERNPVVLGGKKPDLKINGEIFDVYSPTTDRVSTITKKLADKVTEEQTKSVVINLVGSSVTPETLRASLLVDPISGLKKVITLDKFGKHMVIEF